MKVNPFNEDFNEGFEKQVNLISWLKSIVKVEIYPKFV